MVKTEDKNKNIVTNLNFQKDLRQTPKNYDAERALLGAILSNNKAFEQVESFLSKEDFAQPLNQKIFFYIKKVIDKGQIADLNTIKLFFENDEDFKENGGIGYLLKICEDSVSIINAGHYARVIHDLSQRRQLINFGTNLVNNSYMVSVEEDSNEIIEKAEQELYDLATFGIIETGPRAFDSVVSEAINYAEKAFKKDSEIVGLKTGLKDFDKKIGGLHNSDLIIVAGRPSMGKTAFATNIAFNISKHLQKKVKENPNSKGKVLFYSLEMSSEQLATRILSENSGVASEQIRTGNISKNDFTNLVKSSEELSNLALFIDDSPALSVSSIRTRARRLKRKEGLDLIIIDYLQLITSTSKNLNDNRVKEVSDITRGLKALAKELNVPVIALSQLSRKVEDREEKRPQLSDLRESGAIEQDADLVIFLYREEYYLARTEPTEGTEKHTTWVSKMDEVHNLAEAIIAKHRHGPISKVKLHFNPSSTKFSDFIDNNNFSD
ncbi:MAG: replicative DNA helicase [Rickettsiales bacterium]|nr:replicative DNA helicase [Rickettsiales bacterium]